VLTALRQRRNRPLLHGCVLVWLLSWLALLVSAACLMPPASQAAPAAMAYCPAEQSVSHKEHAPRADCSLKLCLDSPSGPGFVFGAEPPQPPAVIPWLFLLIGLWLHPLRTAPPARPPDPPAGRRIPLIYRYCTLLN
jgi:hypothetical protein